MSPKLDKLFHEIEALSSKPVFAACTLAHCSQLFDKTLAKECLQHTFEVPFQADLGQFNNPDKQSTKKQSAVQLSSSISEDLQLKMPSKVHACLLEMMQSSTILRTSFCCMASHV